MFDYKKTVAVLWKIASVCGSVDKLKAAKLVYIMDREHLKKYGRTITGDWYYALRYGPVPSSTLNLLNADAGNSAYRALGKTLDALAEDIGEALRYRDEHIRIEVALDDRPFIALGKPDFDLLSESDVEEIDVVLKRHSRAATSSLVDLVHEFPEWKRHWHENGKRERIPEEEIVESGSKRAQALFELSK